MEVKAPGANCQACPLANAPFVPPVGDKGAKIALVGEAPGRTEVTVQEPFVGESGRVLNHALKEAGLARETLWITNAVLCHPEGNKTPTQQAIACCRPRLQLELQGKNVVVAVGAIAAQAILEQRTFRVLSERGKPIYKNGTVVLPTLHPAYILRTGGARLGDLVNDIKKAQRLLNKTQVQQSVPYIVIETPEDLSKTLTILSSLPEGTTIFYDLETTSLTPVEAEILCIAFYAKVNGHDEAFIVSKTLVASAEGKRMLSDFFRREGSKPKRFGGHNVQYDNAVLQANGILPPEHFEDTLLQHYILDERPDQHGLKQLAVRLLDVEDWGAEVTAYVKACPKEHKHSYGCVPERVLFPYVARDVCYTAKVYGIIARGLAALPKGRWLYENILQPASRLCSEIAIHGLRIDRDRLDWATTFLQEEIDLLREDLQALCGKQAFNPNSPRQVAEVLFEHFKLPVLTHTEKGEPSTRADAIDRLISVVQEGKAAQFLRILRQYRNASKILSVYIFPLQFLLGNGERAYPMMLLHGTVSGRLTAGIWLTVPRDKTNKYAGIVRSLVIPDDGFEFVSADYDQIELRVGTVESQDEVFKEIFLRGEDPHAATADALFGPGWRDLPDASERRQLGKTFNFAAWYGASPATLARSTGVSEEHARRLLDRFYAEHPAILEWKQRIAQSVASQGFVETVFGRRRRFEVITESLWGDILREACNFPVQSTANDINLLTAIELQRRGYPILLLFHDSILTQVPVGTGESAGKEIAAIAEEVAARVYSDYIPFTMSYEVKKRWGEFSA